MAGKRKFDEPIILPFKIEKEFKDILAEHCRNNGMILSGLIRKLLKEYAEKEGLIKG